VVSARAASKESAPPARNAWPSTRRGQVVIFDSSTGQIRNVVPAGPNAVTGITALDEKTVWI